MMAPAFGQTWPPNPTFDEGLTPFSKFRRTLEYKAAFHRMTTQQSHQLDKPKASRMTQTWSSHGKDDNTGVQSKAQPFKAETRINERAASCQGNNVKTADDEAVTGETKSEHFSDFTRAPLQIFASAPDLLESHHLSQSSSATPDTVSRSSDMAFSDSEGEQQVPVPKGTPTEMAEESKNEQETPFVVDGRSSRARQETPLHFSNPEPRRGDIDQTPTRVRAPVPESIYTGPAASPGDPFTTGTHDTHHGRSMIYSTQGLATFTNPDLFSPQAYQANYNSQSLFSPHTPAFVSHGTPIPTSYRSSFGMLGSSAAMVSSPVPSRALTSNNWRVRALGQTPQPMMMSPSTIAPGQNIYPDYGFQSYPNYGYPTTSALSAQALPYYLTPSSPAQSQVGFAHGQRTSGPFYTRNRINFYGYVPSSCTKESTPTLEEIKDMHGFDITDEEVDDRVKKEQERAERNWPTLCDYDEEQGDDQDDGKWFAQWSGGYVVVNEDLIARSICPADLLQHPCPWDEFEGGCCMVRLCKMVEKYTDYECKDGAERCEALEEDTKEYECEHLHWEVEPSCRFVASGKPCGIVINKGYECCVGHDFEYARQVSRCRFEAHVLGALKAGATREYRKHCIVLNNQKDHHYHIRMARGPEALPSVRVP